MANLKTMDLCTVCKNFKPGSPEKVKIKCGLPTHQRKLSAVDLVGAWPYMRLDVAIPRDELTHVVACDKFEHEERAELAK